MSRNIRKKYPRAPAKATKRRGSDSSSSLNLSDDDSGYSGLEELSDSDEDDEDHVFAAEEEHMISQAKRKNHAPPRPVEEEDDADEEEVAEEADEAEDEDEEDDGDAEDDGQSVQSVSWEGLSSNAPTPQPADNYFTGQGAPVERHVRFAGVPDSDTDSTVSDPEDVGDFFPDIFVEQSSLDPAFRRELERDDDDSSGSGSFWDFHSSQDPWAESEADAVAEVDSDDATATPMASAAPTAASSPVKFPDFDPFDTSQLDLDGYETDGDTTEEDIPEPIIRKKQPRRSVFRASTSDSDTERPPRKRGQPRVGRFSLDDTERKPIAVLNPLTRKMMIFTTPQKQRQFDLAPESFNLDWMSHPGVTQSSPILSNPGHFMMSAMVSSNTFGDFMNTQGPPEAFFPVPSGLAAAFESDDDLFPIEEEDEEENTLELDDFITFNHHDSSDNENENENEEEGDWNTEGDASNPATPGRSRKSSTAEGDNAQVHPLISHFSNNSDMVGAFRRNQINQQLVLSDKVSKESLAFSGPYQVLKGVKRQSMQAVTTPITPVRRQKRKNSFMGMGTAPARLNTFTNFNNVTTSPLYDLNQKRTASGELESDRFKRFRPSCDMEQW